MLICHSRLKSLSEVNTRSIREARSLISSIPVKSKLKSNSYNNEGLRKAQQAR